MASHRHQKPSENEHLISFLNKKNKRFFPVTFGIFIFIFMALNIVGLSQTDAAERFDHPFGRFETQTTKNGIIVAAPHGTYDIRTDSLAQETARKLGAGYVIARGFSRGASRINVNRPTEGAAKTCEREQRTERARDVYDQYVRLMDKSSDGTPLQLYVELHGHTSLPFLNRLEIATTGFSSEDARQLKEKFPSFLAQAKAVNRDYPNLDLLIEPIDKVFFGAGCNKKTGYLSTGRTARSLHMEIPRSARAPENLEATAVLVSSLVRAAMNLTDSATGLKGKQDVPGTDKKSAGSPAR